MYGQMRSGAGSLGVSALLQKASSQLKGERVTKEALPNDDDFEDEGLDAYFSTLKRKQASAVNWDAIDDDSENLISSGDDAAVQFASSGSRFLKKKKKPSPRNSAPAQQTKTPPKTAAPAYNQSAALEKASAFSKKQPKLQKTERVVLSESDMDLSLDEEILATIAPEKRVDLKLNVPREVPKQSVKPQKEPKPSPQSVPQAENTIDTDDGFFASLGLATVDDLLGRKDEESDADVSEAITDGPQTSEIRTDYEPHTARSLRSTTPLRSILSPSPRPTPRLSGSRVRLSLDNVEEVPYRPQSISPEIISTARRSRSPSVVQTESETEIPETIDTEQSSEDDYYTDHSITSGRSSPERSLRWASDYSEDFTGYSHSASRSIRRYSRNLSTDTGTDHYSDDFASVTTEQTSDISRSPSPDLKSPTRSRKNMRSKEVQTGLDVGLHYHWTMNTPNEVVDCDYLMSHADPTSIATHVVSSEALEAMTGYSPSMIMLNDMLKQQLTITSQFLTVQKRIYGSLINSLSGAQGSLLTDGYTTIDDYKRYIKKHRKPVISFDEALKQVKEEMGI